MSYFDDYEDEHIYIRPPKHKRVPTGKPAPKGSVLALARRSAHLAFDPTWQGGRITRTQAYRDLARKLDMKKDECHIINFDIRTCEKVIALYLPNEFEELE